MNYERVIQWVSGPFSVFIGGLAAKWVTSWGFLGALGLPVTGVARAITSAVVFLVAAAVTYAGHHKWLTNAAKWWTSQGMGLPMFLQSNPPTGNTSSPSNPPTSTTTPPASTEQIETSADMLRTQLRNAGLTPNA